MRPFPRRTFLKSAAAVAATAAFAPRHLFAELSAAATGPRVVVVHGADIALMLKTGVEAFGGWGAFVRKGRRVALKPNVGWASTPEQGANTNPAMVEACIRACLDAGADSVAIPENPCSPAKVSFEMSGIGAAARRTGARLYEPDADRDYQSVPIPKGKSLRNVDVVREILGAECLINMPVAKNHGGGNMTACMKNWMGSVRDRGFWHRNDLHQCIADFSTLVRAHLNILDATRIMVTHGPRGPGKLETPNQIVFGTDPVAVDAYAATLFGKQPFDVPYLQLAHEMETGCGDLATIAVEHLRT